MENILVLVDAQNGFLKSDETFHLRKELTKLLELEVFSNVLATKFVNSANSPFARLLGYAKMINAKDTEIPNSIDRHLSVVLQKETYTPNMDMLINELTVLNYGEKPDRVFLAGVDTDCCVLATAIGLFDNGIRPIVLKNYCASNGGTGYHVAGSFCLERLLGKGSVYDKKIKSADDFNKLIF